MCLPGFLFCKHAFLLHTEETVVGSFSPYFYSTHHLRLCQLKKKGKIVLLSVLERETTSDHTCYWSDSWFEDYISFISNHQFRFPCCCYSCWNFSCNFRIPSFLATKYNSFSCLDTHFVWVYLKCVCTPTHEQTHELTKSEKGTTEIGSRLLPRIVQL